MNRKPQFSLRKNKRNVLTNLYVNKIYFENKTLNSSYALFFNFCNELLF